MSVFPVLFLLSDGGDDGFCSRHATLAARRKRLWRNTGFILRNN